MDRPCCVGKVRCTQNSMQLGSLNAKKTVCMYAFLLVENNDNGFSNFNSIFVNVLAQLCVLKRPKCPVVAPLAVDFCKRKVRYY